MVATALEAGARLRFLVVEDPEGTGGLPRPLPVEADVFSAPAPLFRELSGTETPQGILGVFDEPASSLGAWGGGLTPSSFEVPVYLVLDALQDPGNVGTLLRTAAALGAAGAIVLDGTADPWSPKAVRAAAGELFRLPVARASWPEAHHWLGERGIRLVVADATGSDLRQTGLAAPPHPLALLVGNEGAGPRPEALAAAAAVVALPLARGVESLNAAMAGSILLWALGPGRAATPPSTLPPRTP